jgi:hypothetical protein
MLSKKKERHCGRACHGLVVIIERLHHQWPEMYFFYRRLSRDHLLFAAEPLSLMV